MVDMEQIKVVLQGITTLAALIKLRRETQELEREPTAREIEDTSRALASPRGFEAFQANIKQSTLDAIGGVIERARERFDSALSDPANPKQVRDAEEQVARSTICGELKRSKRLNMDSLPDDYEEIWREFQCA
jgi:hypothetical protein